MEKTKHTLNELLVWMFNYILYLEELNLKEKGVEISMNDVHILERNQPASVNSMTHIAKTLMITQGTLTTNVSKLIKKGYVEKRKDENDKRISRLYLCEKAFPVLKEHEAFHETMINRAIKDLGLEENEVLIQSLENILTYFQEEYATKV